MFDDRTTVRKAHTQPTGRIPALLATPVIGDQGVPVTFLDEATWRGKAFSSGWTAVSGGEAPVTEPATGAELGRGGIASPADIAATAAAAAAAQPAWAALPHTERSAILRRAGDIWKAHAEEIE